MILGETRRLRGNKILKPYEYIQMRQNEDVNKLRVVTWSWGTNFLFFIILVRILMPPIQSEASPLL